MFGVEGIGKFDSHNDNDSLGKPDEEMAAALASLRDTIDSREDTINSIETSNGYKATATFNDAYELTHLLLEADGVTSSFQINNIDLYLEKIVDADGQHELRESVIAQHKAEVTRLISSRELFDNEEQLDLPL